MAAKPVGVERLLILSRRAGRFSTELEDRLKEAFPGFLAVDFDPELDLDELAGADASVVVAGGDGTIGAVMRALAGTRRRLGLLALGTFNNFARSLGIPDDLEGAIEIARYGEPMPITLGRVNGHPFLEIAALGLFGELIALGEAAKDLAFGELGERFQELTAAAPFRYRLRGDQRRSGSAASLVFANTPTTGAGLVVGEGTPEEPYLDLSIQVGRTRSDLLGRLLAAALHRDGPRYREQVLRFRRLVVETEPPVPVYADVLEVGRTPVTVEADAGAVTVMVPRRRR